MSAIRIGTRGSKLAMWQAEWVSAQLSQRGHEVELVQITTRGDRSSQSLSQVGGQGLFTKEIQSELLAGKVDVAVHSLKDLPTVVVEGLTLAAVPQRESTADCLISANLESFEELPPNAKIGTGSARRGSQLLYWRNDVSIQDIRGNVDSRIRKLDEGHYDAIVLAAAGLTRLKLFDRVTQELPAARVLPAVGQGALGLECRSEDNTTYEALAALNDANAQAAVLAERQILISLLAGCLAPVAAYGTVRDGVLHLHARVLTPDGKQMLEEQLSGPSHLAQDIGKQLSEKLLSAGAADLIRLARS